MAVKSVDMDLIIFGINSLNGLVKILIIPTGLENILLTSHKAQINFFLSYYAVNLWNEGRFEDNH